MLTPYNGKGAIILHYKDTSDSTRLHLGCVYFCRASQVNKYALQKWQSEPTSITIRCKIQSDPLLYEEQQHTFFCHCTQKKNNITTIKSDLPILRKK